MVDGRCRWSWMRRSGIGDSTRPIRPGRGTVRGPCSTSLMQGLLVAFMNPPADDEAGFNAWYDEEHVPNRTALTGVLSAKRFKAADPNGPRYLALYDLVSPQV